jgi:signal transduction histidine kinase
VPLTELFRTHAFRTAAIACAAFGTMTLMLFGFIYWQTAWLETERIDQSLIHEYAFLSREKSAAMVDDIRAHYGADLHRQSFAAIFAPDGTRIVGGLESIPAGLAEDQLPHEVESLRRDEPGITREKVRAVAGRMNDGKELVVGRSEQDLDKLRGLVLRALSLGFLPALAASLGIGLFASQRTIARVRSVNQAIARIMQGHLSERLPSAGTMDELDQLAGSVNTMLAEIERLLAEVKGVGDNIAHDLRTPLARLRVQLERARGRASSAAEQDAVLGQAIENLDQSLAIITALLRVGELEAGRRRAGFTDISLAGLLREAADLMAPLAEQRGLQFQLTLSPDVEIRADRELMIEVLVNLVDNAIKFSPSHGSVGLALLHEDAGPVIRIADSGNGIPPHERKAVLDRFYRADPSRHIPGSGLGLSLVAAIVRLHGFSLDMHDLSPGFAVDVTCSGGGIDAKALHGKTDALF